MRTADNPTEPTKQYPDVNTRPEVVSIGGLESEILKSLWNADEPQSAVQVFEAIYFARKEAKNEMASPSTIAVTLSRMVQKGLLRVERKQGQRSRGNKSYYAPTQSRAEMTVAMLDATCQTLTGHSFAFLLAHLQLPQSKKATVTTAGEAQLEAVIEGLRELQEKS